MQSTVPRVERMWPVQVDQVESVRVDRTLMQGLNGCRVFKLSTLEAGLGAIALAIAAAGAFLIAGGPVMQLWMFLGLCALAFALAAGLIVARINQHEEELQFRLESLLPGEIRYSGTGRDLAALNSDELFGVLEQHLQQQQELLNANCLALIHGSQVNPDLAQAEDELSRLRAELAALEDQFRSEQLLSSLYSVEHIDVGSLLNRYPDTNDGSDGARPL